MRVGMFRAWLFACAALLAAACASTSVRDQWFDAGYRGPPFKRILVLGVASDSGERRIFEDVMVERLAVRGVQGVQSYRYLPDGRKASEAEIDAAVKQSGADALMMTRLRKIERRTEVSTVLVPAHFAGFGWYPWYSAWYPVPEVRQYDIAVVETSVFAVPDRKLVWTGITETFNPQSVRQDAPGFADVVLRALASRGLVPAAG